MEGDRRHASRIEQEQRRQERSKHLIVLMIDHLAKLGYSGTVDALQAESGVSLKQYEAADNIDMQQVLQEWEEYQELRFGRRPRLVRKLSAYSAAVDPHSAKAPGAPGSNRPGKAGALPRIPKGARAAAAARGSADCGDEDAAAAQQQQQNEPPQLGAEGRRARPRVDGEPAGGARSKDGSEARGSDPSSLVVSGHNAAAAAAKSEEAAPGDWEHRIRKSGLPPAMAANAELRELASWLQRDMIQDNPNVRWDDIADLSDVKRVLKESLVMPLRYPHFFTGLLQPWKGVLLYGPPGTGKTLLAKAVATECRTTFFNISASSIVSKWRGDSEKLVRVLFDLARHHAPSTIFINEIDSLMSARGDSGEHEGSRRMKTELLVQMDGLLACAEQVFVLAATNLPWELDMALLRRLEKRILVPFPSDAARVWIVQRLLPRERIDASLDYGTISQQTDGYSGSDLTLVCKEAAMRPLRRLLAQIETTAGGFVKVNAELQPGPVTIDDLRGALASTKATVHTHDRLKYEQWASEFGSV